MKKADAIRKFHGEHRWLSNFWPATVLLDNVTYPTVEHAYCAAKTLHHGERQSVRQAASPGAAKRLGRRLTLRPDWESVKLQIMTDLVRQKFSADPLRSMLADTGDMLLEEGNEWNDRFWGVCRGTGENHLGRILMKIRQESRP